MKHKKVLIPLPRYGCDPSEVAIPWLLLKEQQFEITFITPDGHMAIADEIMLTGKSLGLLKPVLKARQDAVNAYRQMESSVEFTTPLKYTDVKVDDFDGLLLPGGHDKGVREYLESDILQKLVVGFFNENKPVAAVCHGVLIPARSIDPKSQKSVIYDYQCTGLLKRQELTAYHLTRLWLNDYYLTYPETTTEDELIAALACQSQFMAGSLPLARDNLQHLSRGFIVKDRNYLSARWPGDIYNFSLKFIDMLTD
ncbi:MULTISPECIES: type 1 glutamine amidotransferase domain-containing protein [unclassified Colwellia]|uniref:type 1 glutamine amidotransferase domain-containing protein n=1 Tax=unclassified Colwellia TaxID=196834 RepID=UPI0015F698F2|nr:MULTISPECIES: type 1 glutamine amidotransferase domain-containing protein [unclassified Colwellia]MBA6231618.1 DJ-1/PfpI family protein [Colwellia sp. MB02u-7]MBA6235482.1 DJ-1/PfpI family protein [Colwellia sp. MB02u-11]MBA6258036.1 DJ-1/PfpI family protein [Colwellia sp. MB3u-28]MBA6259730.1 DJ-1/PfpI family protein [Colwellia sp. MB3u-41]MBA6299814.1 DJ-1/PfpI family protein [Colwellia sp. MB3u-22]